MVVEIKRDKIYIFPFEYVTANIDDVNVSRQRQCHYWIAISIVNSFWLWSRI